MSIGFHTGYFDKALNNLDQVVEAASEDLMKVANVDTLVGTGFSGAVVVPYLAARLGLNFVLVRKPGDDSHHGRDCLVGNLGERWVFVDDFISSGATRRRVVAKVREQATERGFLTQYIGDYLYRDSQFNTYYADEINQEES